MVTLFEEGFFYYLSMWFSRGRFSLDGVSCITIQSEKSLKFECLVYLYFLYFLSFTFIFSLLRILQVMCMGFFLFLFHQF